MSWNIKGITVLTDLRCSSGTARADLPVLDLDPFVIEEEIVDWLVTRKMTLGVPRDWVDLAEIVARRVLLVQYVDATAGYSGLGWDEFRIASVEESVGNSNTMIITALGIEYDLGERDQPVYQTDNGVVSFSFSASSFDFSVFLTNWLIPFVPAIWSLGTITPTSAITVAAANYTALQLARAAAAAYYKAYGSRYEVSVRPNALTGYYLDITSYGASATVPDLLTNKNLEGVRRTKRTEQQTTRAVPTTSGGGLGRPYYLVTAVSAGVHIEVTDMAGGPGPAQEADQYNNLYVIDDANGTHQVTDTVVVSSTTTRFLMASTAGIAVNELVWLAFDSSRNELPWIDSPSLQTTWGKKLGFLATDQDQYTNAMLNGDMNDWTGAAPANKGACTWAKTGANLTNVLSTFVTGGRSALVGSASGIVGTTPGLYCAAGDVVTLTAILKLNALGGNNLQFTNPDTGGADNFALDGTVAGLTVLNQWLTFSRSYTITAAGIKASGCQLVCAIGQTDYLDSFSYTRSSGAVPWRLGSGPAKAIQVVNSHFVTNGAPVVQYDITILDLKRVDPDGAGQFEGLTLGVTANLTETALSEVTTQRVLRIRTNQRVAHDTQIGLANTPAQLTRLLAA